MTFEPSNNPKHFFFFILPQNFSTSTFISLDDSPAITPNTRPAQGRAVRKCLNPVDCLFNYFLAAERTSFNPTAASAWIKSLNKTFILHGLQAAKQRRAAAFTGVLWLQKFNEEVGHHHMWTLHWSFTIRCQRCAMWRAIQSHYL